MGTTRENIIKSIGHAVGAIVTVILCLIAVRGLFVLDLDLRPCEIVHRARIAEPEVAFPGQKVRISGLYEIAREGCHARFYPVVSWVSTRAVASRQIASNTVQEIEPYPIHFGSFPVDKPTGAQSVGRTYVIPEDALPGTFWSSQVTAVWDRWAMPLGLSAKRVEYRPVYVRVLPPDE